MPVFADEPTKEQLDFFEGKIRPILSEKCYKCHSATADMGQDIIRDFVVGTDQLLVVDLADWTVTSTGTQDLVITNTEGETIRFRNLDTNAVVLADLV